MNIGQATSMSEVSAKMIRYCESIGLVASAARSAGNYRTYGDNDTHTLRFIGRARTLGFSMEQIRESLRLWENKRRASATVKAVALQRIQELDARIAAFTGMRNILMYLAQHCNGDDRPACPTLGAISSTVPEGQPVAHAARH